MNALLRPLLFFVTLVAIFPTFSRADAASELDAAFDRLQHQSYRKRDLVTGYAGVGTSEPMVTEYAQGRTRSIVVSEVPPYGRVRQEKVTIGSRAAVRTEAPGIKAQLEHAKRSATTHSVGSLVNQAVSLGAVVATGGVSGISLAQSAISTATTVAATAQARAAIDQTTATYGRWQRIPDDEVADAGSAQWQQHGPGLAASAGQAKVERVPSRDGRTIKYHQRATDPYGGGDVVTVVTVNAATGLPVSEEVLVNQQRVARTEYYDIGAPIVIEVPDVLR